MNPTLEGFAAAVFEDARASGDARAVADDLAALRRTVLENGALSAVLTDTALPGPTRRAVVEDLLADRLGTGAQRLAAFAAGSVPGPEVPSAIDWLSMRAVESTDGVETTERPLGLGAARERVGGYASALFDTLPTDRLEELEDELFRFARTVEATPALRTALSDRDQAVEARSGIVQQLLAGKVQPETLRLVEYVVRGGRPRDFVGTLDWLVEQTAAARGWRVARVRSAAPVDADQQTQLAESLSQVAGAPVELQITVDPALLGGAVVQIGDLLVDATARGRLNRLREHLLPGGWENRGFGRTIDTSSEGTD